jgi:predicted GIY-YIG superfamily endonuclease
MKYSVYLIKNTTTNKIYIGYTKLSVYKRWQQHKNRAVKNDSNTPFYNAIRKYGFECWTIFTLFESENILLEEIKQKEIYYINFYDSFNNGYNATIGGDGNTCLFMKEETKQKISLALKGRKKDYLRMHGKKHSSNTIEKMRKPKKDKTRYQTPQFKEKMRNVQLEYSIKRRSLTIEQYEQIFYYLSLGVSKKEISKIINIKYDLVKKWSCRSW